MGDDYEGIMAQPTCENLSLPKGIGKEGEALLPTEIGFRANLAELTARLAFAEETVGLAHAGADRA